MAVTAERRMSLRAFLALPEQEPALELEADGRVSQKVAPKGRHSALQGDLAAWFDRLFRESKTARAFTELRATYSGASYVPDISVYRWDRIPRSPTGDVADDFREPPDLVVEIASPDQSVNALLRRCVWYVQHRVQSAWLVDPDDESVSVIRPGAEPRVLVGDEPLDLGEIRPGVSLTPRQVFAALRMG